MRDNLLATLLVLFAIGVLWLMVGWIITSLVVVVVIMILVIQHYSGE